MTSLFLDPLPDLGLDLACNNCHDDSLLGWNASPARDGFWHSSHRAGTNNQASTNVCWGTTSAPAFQSASSSYIWVRSPEHQSWLLQVESNWLLLRVDSQHAQGLVCLFVTLIGVYRPYPAEQFALDSITQHTIKLIQHARKVRSMMHSVQQQLDSLVSHSCGCCKVCFRSWATTALKLPIITESNRRWEGSASISGSTTSARILWATTETSARQATAFLGQGSGQVCSTICVWKCSHWCCLGIKGVWQCAPNN